MFHYSIIYSKLKPDTEAFRQTINSYKNMLHTIGGAEVDMSSEPESVTPFFFMATGGTEEALIRLVEQMQKKDLHPAVYLIAHPEFNSLPASLEALARLQMDGLSGEVIYFNSPDDQAGQDRIRSFSGSHPQ